MVGGKVWQKVEALTPAERAIVATPDPAGVRPASGHTATDTLRITQ
jgi:hypothetical protein